MYFVKCITYVYNTCKMLYTYTPKNNVSYIISQFSDRYVNFKQSILNNTTNKENRNTKIKFFNFFSVYIWDWLTPILIGLRQ